MTELRPYVRTRVLVDYDTFLDGLGTDVLVCTNMGVLGLLRVLIESYGRREANWVTSHGQGGYYSVDAAQLNIIDEFVSEFLRETTNMALCDDISTKFDQLIAAITAQGGCGCGAGGAGGTSPPVETLDTGDITPDTGTPPDGYDTWEQYQLAKCDLSHWIVQNMIDDIGWWETFGIADLTVAAMAAGMASVLSGFTLTALLAAVAGLWAYSVSTLDQMVTTLTADYDDLVCAIMTGENAQDSIDQFLTEANGALAVDITDSIALYFAQLIVSNFADTAQFNLLYAPHQEVLGKQIPEGDGCEGCGLSCNNYQMQYGEYLGGGLFSSLFQSAYYRVAFWINNNNGGSLDPCGDMESITIDAVTGHTHSGSGNNDFRVWEDGSPITLIYDSDTDFTGQTFCARVVAVVSATPFTMQVTRNGKC